MALAWLLTVAPLPWPVPPVLGAVFTVNTTADTVDATPGDGMCADSSGNCSLRAAIMEANALSGPDTIVLQSGQTYTLSLDDMAGDENTAAEDDLDVVAGSTITIQGNGATIQRSTAVPCLPTGNVVAGEFRIFEVLGGMTPGNLTLQNVTVRNGARMPAPTASAAAS
jgi:CSLREA domain-containing protein